MPRSPIKCLLLFDEEERLRALDWSDYEDRMRRLLVRQEPTARIVRVDRAPGIIRAVLAGYFEGADMFGIETMACQTGGTEFQKAVWRRLRSIGAGTTSTYGQMASDLGIPGGARAVGLANGANPIGVVIPCHRVIGANGSLTGYGGGVHRKRWLLEHEGAVQSTGKPIDFGDPSS